MSQKETNKKDITRKDALKKMGSYAAFAALRNYDYAKPSKGASSFWRQTNPGFGGGSGRRRVRINRNKK